MVSTRKNKQSKRRLLSQLDDFDQDIIIGNAASESQENIAVKKGNKNRDLTIDASSNNIATNESTVNVKTLERCSIEKIDREMSNIVNTVEDRIQNAILTAFDDIVAPKSEWAIRSINASSGRDATTVIANSERKEHVGIKASFENASENNSVLQVSNVNDDTRHNIPDELSELLVPETRFDRQTHTHHSKKSNFTQNHMFSNLKWFLHFLHVPGRNISNDFFRNFQNVEFFFGLWAKNFWLVFSKLLPTCPEEHFEQKTLKNFKSLYFWSNFEQ